MNLFEALRDAIPDCDDPNCEIHGRQQTYDVHSMVTESDPDLATDLREACKRVPGLQKLMGKIGKEVAKLRMYGVENDDIVTVLEYMATATRVTGEQHKKDMAEAAEKERLNDPGTMSMPNPQA